MSDSYHKKWSTFQKWMYHKNNLQNYSLWYITSSKVNVTKCEVIYLFIIIIIKKCNYILKMALLRGLFNNKLTH